MATQTERKPGEYRIEAEDGVVIRAANADDIRSIIRIDERNTGLAKPGYWRDMYERYGQRSQRFFMVAERDGEVPAFILGEVRAWEFGSPPCGWVFALGVDPDCRLERLGTRLFGAICECFREAGMDTVRTVLAVDDNLNMSFFRSQGMRAGRFIELEMELDE